MRTDQWSNTRTAQPDVWSAARPRPALPERWRLLRLLGHGGQGDVWLAEDTVLQQRVAIKVIDRIGGGRTGEERTRREARLGRSLEHPHLVRVHDLVETPAHLLVVMEWLPSGSLRQELEAGGPLPVARVVDVAGAALEVLAYLHHWGVVHRDVKVSNLLVTEDGRVKLGDLGLVRQSEVPSDLTRTGITVGTPLYMSPEQLRGEEPAPPSDLYSLGVTLHRLLTGRHPFAASSEFQVADGHLHGRPESVRRHRRDCPRWLAAFVRRLLEKRPEDRWPDAAAALADFRRHRSTLWRRVAARTAAAAMVLAGIGLAGWLAARPTGLARVAVQGDQLVAFDTGGVELWRRSFDGVIRSPLVENLVGSPDAEVALGLDHREWLTDRRITEFILLGHDGGTLYRAEVAPRLVDQVAPHLSSDLELRQRWTTDLRGDGHREVLFEVRHRLWYPSALFLWAPEGGGKLVPILINGGRLEDVRSADIDGDGEPEIFVAGVNNQLGYQHFVAVLRGTGPWVGRSLSPDLVSEREVPHGGPELLSYALLGPVRGTLAFKTIGPEGIVVQRGAKQERLSPRGVPLDSPVIGLSPKRVMGYWRDFDAACREVISSGDTGQLEEVRARYQVVLGDGRVDIASRLVAAASLAQFGRAQAAITALRVPETLRSTFSDVDLRRGELLLIMGRRAEGRSAVLDSMSPRSDGRGAFDATLLLGLDAALTLDRSLLQQIDARALAVSTRWLEIFMSMVRPAFAFCEGQWQDPSLEHGVSVKLFAPDSVLLLWARMERGELTPEQAIAAAESLEGNTERRHVAWLLEATAHLRLGEADAARGLARSALEMIQRFGRTHYEWYFWTPLAETVYGEALLADGEPAAARPHLAEAVRLAPRTWFGRRAAKLLADGR